MLLCCWLGGRKGIRPVKNLSGGVLVWLSVWSNSWDICKSAPNSRQIITPVPHCSVFLQAGCPSCRPTNSVKALKATPRKTQKYTNVKSLTKIGEGTFLAGSPPPPRHAVFRQSSSAAWCRYVRLCYSAGPARSDVLHPGIAAVQQSAGSSRGPVRCLRTDASELADRRRNIRCVQLQTVDANTHSSSSFLPFLFPCPSPCP